MNARRNRERLKDKKLSLHLLDTKIYKETCPLTSKISPKSSAPFLLSFFLESKLCEVEHSSFACLSDGSPLCFPSFLHAQFPDLNWLPEFGLPSSPYTQLVHKYSL